MFRLAAILAFGFLALPAAGQGVIRAEPHFQTRSTAPADPSPARHASPGHAFRVELGAPSPEEVAARLSRSRKEGAPMQIGFARDVAALRDSAAFRRALSWETLPSGTRVAAIAITSPEAAAIRIPLAVGSLPPSAILRFYGAAPDSRVFEVTGARVLETIQRNLAAGDRTPEGRTFYSPEIEGATAVVEIELPAAAEADLAIPAISHLVTAARLGYVVPKAFGDSDACEKNVMCQPEWAGVEGNAVALMDFCERAFCYNCTGTLLANLQPGSTTPYFLTANHCISTQTVASTLQTWWFYRHPTCTGSTTEPDPTILAGGATLLFATENTDTSFLRLNDAAPGGSIFAGWITGPVLPTGTDITGIHHPSGDVQKISAGDITGYYTCTPQGQGFKCSVASAGAATFYQVVWRDGVTEGGSSGSAIWDDAGQYVRGQLYGGSSFCTDPTAPDYYGRFDVAFNASLKTWLAPPLLVSVASRKFHAGASSFDLPIDASVPVTGAVSVEPRVAGTSGHQVVFTFDTTVALTGTATSTGADGLPLGTASPMAGANEVTVTLSGVPATARVKVTLAGVNGSGASYSASVGLLVGDVGNPLRAVDSIDVDAIKSHSGASVAGDVYPFDLNLSGAVTAADILVAKGRVGLGL